MKFVKPQPLTPAQERRLSDFLESAAVPAGTLNLNQLRGYLFCIGTTPAPLQPSFWLPPIFNCEGELPELSSAAASRQIEAILQLYNQIMDEILQGTPALPAGCALDEVISRNFQPGSVLHDWSWGFDFGMGRTAAYWAELPLAASDLEELEACWTALSLFADEEDAHITKPDTPGTPTFEQAMTVIGEQLPQIVVDYAQTSRAVYEAVYLAGGREPGAQAAAGAAPSRFQDDAGSTSADALLQAAWDSRDLDEAVDLARQALALEPDNVDALLFLSRWDAYSPAERLDYLREAVGAGASQLGPEYFEEHVGHFWGLLETRPYMRAQAELAAAYRDNQQPAIAIELLQELLRLNPNDNQGNRYLLATLYLEQRQYPEARALLDQYLDDDSAFVRFSRLLLDYAEAGDTPGTRQQRREAKSYNKHVAPYLSARRKLPKSLPDRYCPGDKDEAILYAAENRSLWRQVKGAIAWLMK